MNEIKDTKSSFIHLGYDFRSNKSYVQWLCINGHSDHGSIPIDNYLRTCNESLYVEYGIPSLTNSCKKSKYHDICIVIDASHLPL